MSVKFSLECDSPLEFYNIIAAIADRSPMAPPRAAPAVEKATAASSDAAEAGEAPVVAPAEKPKRGRPAKAEKTPEPAPADAPADTPEAAPTETEVTPQMAFDAISKLHHDHSAREAVLVAKAVFGDNPRVSIDNIKATGKAAELYAAATAKIRELAA